MEAKAKAEEAKMQLATVKMQQETVKLEIEKLRLEAERYDLQLKLSGQGKDPIDQNDRDRTFAINQQRIMLDQAKLEQQRLTDAAKFGLEQGKLNAQTQKTKIDAALKAAQIQASRATRQV